MLILNLKEILPDIIKIDSHLYFTNSKLNLAENFLFSFNLLDSLF